MELLSYSIVKGWHRIQTIAASDDVPCWQTPCCTFPAAERADVSVSGTFLKLNQETLRTIGMPASENFWLSCGRRWL